MSNRTEKQIKQDIYNKVMDIFITEYNDAAEAVSSVSTEIEDNRNFFYDMLQAKGTFCLRNNPEEYPLSIRLDDFITSLSHILAEERQLCVEDMDICFSEESNYEDWWGIPAV